MAESVANGADQRPLEGIRVLDFTRVVAGPLATRMMADMGAEVIKIEPTDGDLSRTFPPHAPGDVNPYFSQQNAGKRFCSIDLRAAGATELVRELVGHCDAVVENYRPGVMEKFGLGPDEMCALHPALVYCSVTGFGQTGPWANRRAYAPVGHMESGYIDYSIRKTGARPSNPPLVVGDIVTAMSAAASVNAMLVKAARTGRGGHIDVCMVEAMVYIQEWSAVELAGGWEEPNAGLAHECPILVLPDGRVWAIAGNPAAWFDDAIKAMGRPELAVDPRFATSEARMANRYELYDEMTQWAVGFSDVEEFRRAIEAGTPFSVAEMRSITELAATDWAEDRGLFTEASSGFAVPARPALGSGIGTDGHVAARGADNREAIGGLLGLDNARLAELEAAGVLVAD
ncbi:CaiB/BaiF CoA transferase family protein [Candidatus Poriferisodalis sp.]|uniref:CaiB/BaiF CoA transferase family protein n=1 Tax=Candidatus Poriferisodalis sp. TaxID=3101277 RepID=UPI003B5BC97A